MDLTVWEQHGSDGFPVRNLGLQFDLPVFCLYYQKYISLSFSGTVIATWSGDILFSTKHTHTQTQRLKK